MKKSVLLLLLLCLPLLLTVPTAAEEQTDSFLASLQETLPDAARPHLPSDTTDTDALRKSVGIKHLFSMLAEAVSTGFSTGKAGFFRLFGITLLFSAVAAVSKGKGAALFVESAATLSLYGLLFGCVERVMTFFSDLSAFSMLLSPLYTAALAAGGRVAGAAAAGSAFTGFITILDVLATGLLGPLLRVLFALSLLSVLGNSGAVKELTGRISGFYVFLLSLCGVLLTAALAFEGSLASSADSVAVRTVKFAIGNAVPVVGGTVSSLLGSMQASLSLIKSAMGATSLIVLLSLLLPLLAELALWRFALSLCDGVAGLMGASTLSGVFGRFRKLCDLMLAGSAIVSLLFLLTVGLLSHSVAV